MTGEGKCIFKQVFYSTKTEKSKPFSFAANARHHHPHKYQVLVLLYEDIAVYLCRPGFCINKCRNHSATRMTAGDAPPARLSVTPCCISRSDARSTSRAAEVYLVNGLRIFKPLSPFAVAIVTLIPSQVWFELCSFVWAIARSDVAPSFVCLFGGIFLIFLSLAFEPSLRTVSSTWPAQ